MALKTQDKSKVPGLELFARALGGAKTKLAELLGAR